MEEEQKRKHNKNMQTILKIKLLQLEIQPFTITQILVKSDDVSKIIFANWKKKVDEWNEEMTNNISKSLKTPNTEVMVDKILKWINYKNGLYPPESKILIKDDLKVLLDTLSDKRRYYSKSWKYTIKWIMEKENYYIKKLLIKWKQDVVNAENEFV
jgi:hypothetical protein